MQDRLRDSSSIISLAFTIAVNRTNTSGRNKNSLRASVVSAFGGKFQGFAKKVLEPLELGVKFDYAKTNPG